MSFFIVVRKSILSGVILMRGRNPSAQELLINLQSYPQIYLFDSLDKAQQAAETFFWQPRPPKTEGAYGLVAEIEAKFENSPTVSIDAATIFNNWVDSQELGYIKKELTGIFYDCIAIKPEQVTSILNSYIPKNAQAYNQNLVDTDFTQQTSSCTLF